MNWLSNSWTDSSNKTLFLKKKYQQNENKEKHLRLHLHHGACNDLLLQYGNKGANRGRTSCRTGKETGQRDSKVGIPTETARDSPW